MSNKSRLDLAQIKGQLESTSSLSDDFEILNKMFFWDEIKNNIEAQITLYIAGEPKPITPGTVPTEWEGYTKETTYKISGSAYPYKKIVLEYDGSDPDSVKKEQIILYKDDGSELMKRIKTYFYDASGNVFKYETTST